MLTRAGSENTLYLDVHYEAGFLLQVKKKKDWTHTEKSITMKCPWAGWNTIEIAKLRCDHWTRNVHWGAEKQVEKKQCMLTAKDFFFWKEFLVVSHLILYLEFLVSSASISLQLHKTCCLQKYKFSEILLRQGILNMTCLIRVTVIK